MRNNVFWVIAALCILSSGIQAQVQSGDSLYALRLDLGYSYNKTYSHHFNADIGAFVPINRHFELQADVRLSSANFYTAATQLRPKFPLKVGELYIETRAAYRAIVRNNIQEATGGLSLGYRMQYINVQIGCGMRVFGPYGMKYHSSDRFILEPFIVLYRVEAFVRPQTSRWNIAMAIGNIDNWQMERMWQPIFMLGGRFDADRHWRVYLSSECKPTGMFHLNAAFYAADLRAGVEYRF